jgi:hypothetical protein
MDSEPEGTGRRPQVSRQNLGTWRFGNFLFPFWTQVPNGEFGRHVQVRGWVPLDDEHTMYCVLWWKRGVSVMTQHTPGIQGRSTDRRYRAPQRSAQYNRLARPLAACR